MRFFLGLFALATFMSTSFMGTFTDATTNVGQRTNVELMAALVDGGRRQYQDIMLYNDLHRMVGSCAGAHEPLSTGLEGLMNVYDRLYSYGFSLAGYQFIGLAVSSINDDISLTDQIAFFLLSCGFVMSCFSALLSFCMYEYICGIRHESNEFIVAGMNTYRIWLFLPHPLLLFNTGLFIVPFNILVHNMLLPYFAVGVNLVSGVLCGGFYIHRQMIVDKQEYVFLDAATTNMDSNTETVTLCRHINECVDTIDDGSEDDDGVASSSSETPLEGDSTQVPLQPYCRNSRNYRS